MIRVWSTVWNVPQIAREESRAKRNYSLHAEKREERAVGMLAALGIWDCGQVVQRPLWEQMCLYSLALCLLCSLPGHRISAQNRVLHNGAQAFIPLKPA